MPTIKISPEISNKLQQYSNFLMTHEYTKSTIDSYKTYLSRFLRWLSVSTEKALCENIKNFLTGEQKNHPKTLYECRAALYQYFELMTGKIFSLNSVSCDDPEIKKTLNTFYEYSIHIKHIKEETAVSEVNHIRRFLYFMYKSRFNYCLDELTANDIRSFPTTLDYETFNRLSDIPNMTTAAGKRNYAIILCFTELALRCIEVASLSVDDFDWYNG